jgi:hypothetical protein
VSVEDGSRGISSKTFGSTPYTNPLICLVIFAHFTVAS